MKKGGEGEFGNEVKGKVEGIRQNGGEGNGRWGGEGEEAVKGRWKGEGRTEVKEKVEGEVKGRWKGEG